MAFKCQTDRGQVPPVVMMQCFDKYRSYEESFVSFSRFVGVPVGLFASAVSYFKRLRQPHDPAFQTVVATNEPTLPLSEGAFLLAPARGKISELKVPPIALFFLMVATCIASFANAIYILDNKQSAPGHLLNSTQFAP